MDGSYGSYVLIDFSILCPRGIVNIMIRSVAAIFLLLVGESFGQTPNPPAFDVASVKPSARQVGKDARGEIATGPDRLSGRNVSLKSLIVEAYHLQQHQVSGGPNWLDSDEFDIDARAGAPASKEQLGLMLRTLLADRFRLSLHRETRELRVYALVVDKGGPKLHAASNAENSAGKSPTARFPNFHGDMRQLTSLLSIQLSIPTVDDPGRPAMASGPPAPVLDKTGLTGTYEFTVARPDPSADMFTAWQRFLQDQLGLKLESQKGPVEVLVVDHAERTPIAN